VRAIFDPFVSSKLPGSGLGLSLVTKIIADPGGGVECVSRPGRTHFRVRLPVWRGLIPQDADESSAPAAQTEA
jgi:two-component system nitrogen regulation sensor histidine kinase GlnL